MIRLLITAALGYALYINFSGVCDAGYRLGCFDSNTTLLVVFGLYLAVGVLFFMKKWFRLYMHRAHYRVKRIGFGFVSMMLLAVGVGIMALFASNLMGENLLANLSGYL